MSEYLDFINSKSSYEINELGFKQIVQVIKKEILYRKKYIEEANKIDNNHWKKKIDIQKLIQVVESLENIKKQNDKTEKLIISYNGNPYLTLSLCIQSLCKNKLILLETTEFMYGVNKMIIQIINDVLKNRKINCKIMQVNELSKQDIENIGDIKIKIVGAYNNIFKYKECKYEFYAYNNYFLLSDDNEQISELEQSIYDYAISNCFEIEVLEIDDLEESFSIINLEKDYIVILLTKDEETKEKAKKSIKENKLYINKNPFEEEEMKIYNII